MTGAVVLLVSHGERAQTAARVGNRLLGRHAQTAVVGHESIEMNAQLGSEFDLEPARRESASKGVPNEPEDRHPLSPYAGAYH